MNKIISAYEEFTPIAEFAMDFLRIEGVTLTIGRNDRLLDRLAPPDIDLEALTTATPIDNTYNMFFRGGKPSKMALCHEMVHLKQYVDGRLSIDKTTGNCNWEGDIFTKDTPYYQRPWEEEAFGLQSTIYKQFKHR